MSHPARASLDAPLADKARLAVGATAVDWLCESVACDIRLPGASVRAEAEAALRAALDGAGIDIVIQPELGRRKKLLIADMDSTMIEQECIDELAAEVGFGAKVAEITARAMNGEIAFEPALRERVALLAGLPVTVIEKVLTTRITLASGGRQLVQTMKSNGGCTVLVSGGFTAFAAEIARKIGFDEHHANVLLEKNGLLTGEVAEPILGRSAKVATLEAVSARLGLCIDDAIAVGDGANDLAMLHRAGTGVALHAKPAVAAEADIRIDHGDLTALLYLQGYAESEFAT